MSSATTSAAFFENLYQQASDPWNFAASRYELNRYARILASLQPRRFSRAFEAGCSIGVLTEQLAGFCGVLEALDLSVTAAGRARDRCRHLSNVNIGVGSIWTDMAPGSYDLIVFSEIGYYFDRDQLVRLGAELSAQLVAGGILLGAHWLGNSADHLLSGDEVHESLASVPNLNRSFSQRYLDGGTGYRIEHWTKS